MAEIKSITLQNFKGAENVTIDFSKRSASPVITLIGLNESGKTTILEGLSYFVSGDYAVSSLFGSNDSESIIAGLIPVHKKAAFTGVVSISAVITLDDNDFEVISKVVKEHKFQLIKDRFPEEVTVTRAYEFSDSVLQNDWNDWDLEFVAKPNRKSGKEQVIKESTDKEPDIWTVVVEAIEGKLPKIAYFPTFLVDMPSRIYLKQHQGELAVNRYYRYVFQDILDSLDEGLSLERHVCKRIEDFKISENTPVWMTAFWGAPSKATIDSVFQKISSAVTKEVLGSWQKVFGRSIAAKSISVEWHIDSQKGDLPYASFVVSDGESRYAISERSLGFRWFFSFLLFTAFKRAAKRPTLFVFDEPAANLHAKAQAELLTSFSRIVADGHKIVYSTHSHHMINPKWLSGAYIIENEALDYDSPDAFGLSVKPTSIKATSYRNFVSQHPQRTSYFQPVIEKLEYVTPEIIGEAPFVIVEGVTDFYALSLVKKIVGVDWKFSLMPGVGSSASGPLISLLLGRGDKFVVLLDDDKSGRLAAERYRTEWYLPDSTVITLKDIDKRYEGKCLEGLLSVDTLRIIGDKYECSGKPTKKQIGLYLSEMYAVADNLDCLSLETKEHFQLVLNELSARIKQMSLGA